MREYGRLWQVELLKQRKNFTWPIVVLTPLLAAALSFINLFLRYDYLINLEANQGMSSWQLLLIQHHFIWAFLLPLVATVLASQVHYLEYKANSWKQALALPVSRTGVYLAKWSLVLTMIVLMVLGNSLCLFLVGKGLQFREVLDIGLFFKYTAYQIMAISGLMGIQCWLSSGLPNPNLALAIGFVGVASSLFFAQSDRLARFIPYAHPIYALPDPSIDNTVALCYGLAFGLAFLATGLMSFQRKEIK